MPTKNDTTKGTGWIPDIPDRRDLRFMAASPVTTLPPAINLSNHLPPVFDQGQTSSCVGHAWATAVFMVQTAQPRKGKRLPVPGSRLFAYYNARLLDGRERMDAGATIRSGIKGIAKYGLPPENLWALTAAKLNVKPVKPAYSMAALDQALEYRAVDLTLDGIRQALASGRPVVLGIALYESFYGAAVATTGVVAMPSGTERLKGGHAIVVYGYDDASQRWLCRNSWGPKWGSKGNFTLPYLYLTSGLAADAWTLTTMER